MPCSCHVGFAGFVRFALDTGVGYPSHMKSETERFRKCSENAFQLLRVFYPDEPLGSLPDTPLLMSLSARNVS